MIAPNPVWPIKSLKSLWPRTLQILLIVGMGILLAGCPRPEAPDTGGQYPPPIVPLTRSIREEAAKIDFAQLVRDAEMAERAYLDDDAEIEGAYGAGRTFVRTDKRFYGKFFVVRDDAARRQFISIRGTASKNDWGDGVDVRKSARVLNDGSRIMFFRGFLEETNNMLPVALGLLKRNYRTRIVGHSRGGAMGLILARLLVDEGFRHTMIEVVTFGQPKITNRDGVNRYPSMDVLRVVNDRDLVARFPFHGPIASANGRYAHIGKALYLWAGNEWSLVPDADERRITRRVSIFRAVEFRVKFHFIRKYLGRLRSVRQARLVGCCRLEPLGKVDELSQ